MRGGEEAGKEADWLRGQARTSGEEMAEKARLFPVVMSRQITQGVRCSSCAAGRGGAE